MQKWIFHPQMTQISQTMQIDYSLCQAHLSECALLFPKCGLHILKSKANLHQLQAAFEKKQGAFFLFHRTLSYLGKKYSHLHPLFIPFSVSFITISMKTKRLKTALFCIFLRKKTKLLHIYSRICLITKSRGVTKCYINEESVK